MKWRETLSRSSYMVRVVLLLFFVSLAVKLYWYGSLPASLACDFVCAQRLTLGEKPYVDFYFDDSPLSIIARLPLCFLQGLLGFVGAGDSLSLSVLILTVLAYLASLYFSVFIYNGADKGRLDKAAFLTLLSGYMLGEIAVSFLAGSRQHLLCLSLSPYLTVLVLRLYGGEARRGDNIFSALLLSLGLGLSYYFLPIAPVLLALEVALAKERGRYFGQRALLLVLMPVLILLGLAALFDTRELFAWILPLKHSQYLVEPAALYGVGRSPDLRVFFYCLTATVLTAFGLTNARKLLYPALALCFCGLSLYLFSVYGLSEQIVLALWSCALLAAMIFAGLAKFIYVKGGAAFGLPQLGRKLAVVGQILTLVLATFLGSGAWLMSGSRLLESPEFRRNLPELRERLKECDASRPVLFLSGRPSPGPALILSCGRLVGGYFISSEPLGTLANLLHRNCDGRWLNKDKDWLADLKKTLLTRLQREIETSPNLTIFIEGGDIYELIKRDSVKDCINKLREVKPNCRYYALPEGASEYADWNYDFFEYVKD